MDVTAKDTGPPHQSRLGWLVFLMVVILFFVPVGHHTLQIAYGLLLVFVILHFHRLRQNWYLGKAQALLVPLIVYIGVCVLGSFGAGFEGGLLSAARLRDHCIGLIFVIFLVDVDAATRLKLTVGLIFGGLVGVSVAFIQFFAGIRPLADLLGIVEKQQAMLHPSLPGHLAGSGLLYDRIPFALLCATLGIFLLGAALYCCRTQLWRIGCLVTALLFFMGPILAGSRMAILLCFFGALWLFTIFSWRQKNKFIIIVLATAVLTLFAAAIGSGLLSYEQMNSSIDTTQNMDRIFIWQRALEIFSDHPLWGTGYGHYPQVAPMVYHTSTPFRPENNHAHNLLLTLLAETGIVGFWAFLFLWWRWGRRFWMQKEEPIVICAAGSCLIFLLASTVHDPWFHSNMVSVFWWFAAVACTPLPERSIN